MIFEKEKLYAPHGKAPSPTLPQNREGSLGEVNSEMNF